MKKKLFRVIEIISFICLLLFAINKISIAKISYCYESNPARSTRLFFELPKNTVDVVFTGDSHMFCGIIPQMFFDEEGISSSSIATPTQFIKNTYWLLKEAYKKQDIKLVVLESHSIEHSLRETDDLSQFTSGIIMLPDYSINKYRNFHDVKNTDFSLCSEITIDDVIPLLQFNSDYGRDDSSLKKIIDFTINPAKYYKTFGYYPQTSINKVDGLYEGNEYDDYKGIKGTYVYEYLNKIYELCKENNTELLLVRMPYNSTNTNLNVINGIFEWANEKNVEVLDYFQDFDGTNIDLNTDFRDNTHLNYLGARKATRYLIDYFKDHYQLDNHKGDSRYSLWENNDFDYEEVLNKMRGN